MKICRLSRPPLKKVSTKFPQREWHILDRLEKRGHEIVRYEITPSRIYNKYVSYSIAAFRSIIHFRKVNVDVVIADNIESAIIALFIKLLYGIPFVFDFIDDYSLIAKHDFFRIRYFMIKVFEKIVPRFSDFVIVVDEHKRRFCKKLGIKDDRMILIPNGADTEVFHPGINADDLVDELGLKGSEVVLFVGRLNKYYRLESIIEAAPLILLERPGAKIVLIGDGDNVEELRDLCQRLKMEHAVLFAGFQPFEEIHRYISCADICYFPLPDSSALVIYEYMACGKATVVPEYHTEKMGISEDIFPGNCIMWTPDTPRGIAEGINKLLKDRTLRKEIGMNARNFVKQEYDWNELTARYEFALMLLPKGEKEMIPIE